MKFLLRILLVLAGMAPAVPAHAAQGIAMYGDLKYPPGFAHFDYVNPDAPKGGTLKLSANAPFDSVNPFILRGIAAPGLTNYVFQTLMTPSYDEPQSYYGLIADSVTLAPDRSYADFTLNRAAKWDDGQPITADDVVWSFNTLKEKGHPIYRIQFKPITIEKLNPRTVRFHFDDKTRRELPLIAASMPVLPQHYYEKVPFDKTTLQPPLGSGPYRVQSIDPGRAITYERVKNYWAANLPSQKGFYNFDTIREDVYRDDVTALEGIKSHQFDFYEEFIAHNWATAYDIPAVKSGALIKARIPHKIPRGMQGFLFNTRLPKFADVRVREAIDLSLDFEWMNKVLFYSAYERNSSYFNNTDFEAKGLPSKEELALLEPYQSQLPPAVFTTAYKVPTTDGSGIPRANLIRAQQLLDDAGWVMRGGHRVNATTGEPLTVEFLMTQRTFERVVAIMQHNLARLGIDATFRYVDASQYQKRVDHRSFDIVSIWWNQGSFYPGAEQYTYWNSSQADIEGSQNLGGIKNKAVDMLTEKILRAQTLAELQPAGRALDRVLLQEHYVIPHWNINAWRVLYWNQFGRPKITPAYNLAIDSWWRAAPGADIKKSEAAGHSSPHRGEDGRGAATRRGDEVESKTSNASHPDSPPPNLSPIGGGTDALPTGGTP
jgi:microcin C transport system substrate-binding protein